MMDRPSDRLPESDDNGPEEDHIAEDGALWAFVEWISDLNETQPGKVSGTVEVEASRFLEWRERHTDRSRWYA
jgi:hypothetical protein